MRELADAIRTYGRGIGKDIVKVDMFLNHRIDTGLLYRMGEALAEHFLPERPTMVLTVEASGIAIAIAAAHALGDLPVVFAKKSAAVNQSGDMAQASVYSFTHKCENHILVDRRYIPIGSRVLIVDDFLADGNAVRGLMDIVSQLGGQGARLPLLSHEHRPVHALTGAACDRPHRDAGRVPFAAARRGRSRHRGDL